MPPPTPYSATWVSVSSTTVRIGTLNRAEGPAAPFGARKPTAPQYTPRGESSSSAMSCIVRTLGAPVTDPQGNSARNTSTSDVAVSSSADTVEVSCHTVSYRSRSNTSLQVTEPVRATRPMSLRSRSTIIAFSARSFTEPRRPAATASSSADQRPRRAVPFIGFVVMRAAVDAEEQLRARPTAPGSARGSGTRRRRRAGRSTGRGRDPARRPPPASAGAGCGSPGRCRRPRCAHGCSRSPRRRPTARPRGATHRRARRREASAGSGSTVGSRSSNIANHASGRRANGSAAARSRTRSDGSRPAAAS